MIHYAAVTDFEITIYSFDKLPTGKPVIEEGRRVAVIDMPDDFKRSFRNYEELLRANDWTPSGHWGFASARLRNSEQPCIRVS